MINFSLNNNYKDLDLYSKKIKKITKKISKLLKIKEDLFFEISILNNNEIKQINKQYRKKNSPTDVISFSFNDNGNYRTMLIGEIFISYDKVISQSTEYGHSMEREYLFLITHGLLHLLGYDHISNDDEKIMFDLQEKVLEKICPKGDNHGKTKKRCIA